MKPKQLVSTGKVIWLIVDGESSSPVRFVLDGDNLYFRRNARHERIPHLEDGQTVRVVGHPLAKQTRSGEAEARVTFLDAEETPQPILLELAGAMYDPRLTPDENFARLKHELKVARLDLL